MSEDRMGQFGGWSGDVHVSTDRKRGTATLYVYPAAKTQPLAMLAMPVTEDQLRTMAATLIAAADDLAKVTT